jgi:hypothetical protein
MPGEMRIALAYQATPGTNLGNIVRYENDYLLADTQQWPTKRKKRNVEGRHRHLRC